MLNVSEPQINKPLTAQRRVWWLKQVRFSEYIGRYTLWTESVFHTHHFLRLAAHLKKKTSTLHNDSRDVTVRCNTGRLPEDGDVVDGNNVHCLLTSLLLINLGLSKFWGFFLVEKVDIFKVFPSIFFHVF